MSAPQPTARPTKIECVDCAKRPPLPDGVAIINKREFRPRALRKIDPRSLETHKTQPRCQEDWLVWDRTRRAKMAAARSRKRSGLTEEGRQEVLALQGGVCPACKRGPGRKRSVLAADHDHRIAEAECAHDPRNACEHCLRGFLCDRENRHILGLLFANKDATTEQVIGVLRNLADYLEDPPAQQWRRRDLSA